MSVLRNTIIRGGLDVHFNFGSARLAFEFLHGEQISGSPDSEGLSKLLSEWERLEQVGRRNSQ